MLNIPESARFKTPSMQAYPKVKMDSIQTALWAETRAAVLWATPSFSDIWYAMMIDEKGTLVYTTNAIPVAATDDKLMYINPEKFFQYTLGQRIFICCHEVCHAMFNHCGLFYKLRKQGFIKYPDGVKLPFIIDLMQITADCVINAILVKGKIGELPPDAWHIPDIIPDTMNILDAYRKLYKMAKKSKMPDGTLVLNLPLKGKSFDTHLDPGEGQGEAPSEAMSKRDEQQWKNAINAAMESARLAGKLPANIERLFKITMDVGTDWKDLLPAAILSSIGRDGYSWNLLDQQMAIRGIGFPGRRSYGSDSIVVITDSSGSINQPTMNMMCSHTAAIIDQCKPKELILCECDATIHSWKVIDDINDLNGRILGGGGTDFRPPFQKIAEEGLEPDVVVYLTDLCGPFPDREPPYPVVWGCVEKNMTAPWGKTVYIPPLKVNDEDYAGEW